MTLSSDSKESLPVVKCVARARIPTTTGPDIFLHLYANDRDNKEHLAIVFGEDIRSRTLFQRRKGETQQDRMVRGAYVGKLFPGRTMADSDENLGLSLKFDETTGALQVDPKTTWHDQKTLVRVHSECYTGETAWSARCDCGEQFDHAGKLMGVEREGDIIGGAGRGVIVYLRQEGRGIGLGEKLKAYNLQDLGADTVQANLILKHPADGRDFSLGRAILLDLGISKVRLLTNNPDKVSQAEYPPHLHCVERVPMVPLSWTSENEGIHSSEIEGYLRTKVERMGHLLQRPLKLHSHATKPSSSATMTTHTLV
ncbi:LAME_0F02784g1_1 [Lachancea meyersii CBS 8951]|uniref:GTP cyclohydrolase II n=1 Tax=Lachancea meyersii CBS 8951 TaxID=1266667 RepID=A0A1G4JQT3_9SACH|nr:LAME_0F02784g1_1 [Lachancea meyersii CBS 8951]